MAQQQETKYPNNIRTVSGTVVVFDTDSVLLCDTSSGPVTINLLGIPLNYFSTQYKLYIVDKSNNASVNNIVINAGTGVDSNNNPVSQTINGSSSFTINNNGAGCIIRNTANYTYISQYSVVSSGGGFYQTIQDEGVSLPQRAKINFIGGGVNATDDPINNATIVNVLPGNLINVTYTQATTLVSSNSLIPGAFYNVTDAAQVYLVSGGIILQATSNNTFSLEGKGIFLNADYDNQGDYSGSPIPKTGNSGVWAPNLPSTPIGNVVIYDNKNYINITGVNTSSAPPFDTTNWSQLTKSKTTGYIEVVDFVIYDFAKDILKSRQDVLNNYIENSFTGSKNPLINFQWGRADCYLNKITGVSEFEGTNMRMQFLGNTFSNSSFKCGGYYNASTQGQFSYNTVSENYFIEFSLNQSQVFGKITLNNFIAGPKTGYLQLDMFDSASEFERNNFFSSNLYVEESVGSKFYDLSFNLSSVNFTGTSNDVNFAICCLNQSGLDFNNCSSFLFQANNLIGRDLDFGTQSGNIIGNYADVLINTFQTTLDLSDASIYDAGTKTLTIPISKWYAGVYILTNCTGLIIKFIQNYSGLQKYVTYKPDNGETVSFEHTSVGSLVDGCLLSDAALTNLLTGRNPGSDYIEYMWDKQILGSTVVFMRNNLVLLA